MQCFHTKSKQRVTEVYVSERKHYVGHSKSQMRNNYEIFDPPHIFYAHTGNLVTKGNTAIASATGIGYCVRMRSQQSVGSSWLKHYQSTPLNRGSVGN